MTRSTGKLFFGLWVAVFSVQVQAASVASGNLIVQGNQCVGFDCMNDQVFAGAPMQLFENNTRIALRDLSAASHGFSWVLRANDRANGGADVMALIWRSDTQQPVLSDGTAPNYDCTATPDFTNPDEPFPVTGTIPAGDPIETPFCGEVTAYTDHPALQLRPDGSVTLGRDATPVSEQVSVGGAELQRRIRHLADAVETTDALVKRQMEAYQPLASRREQISQLNAQTAALEEQLASLNQQLDQWSEDDGGGVGLGSAFWLLSGLFLTGLRRRIRARTPAGLLPRDREKVL